jgi:hypothetical protein
MFLSLSGEVDMIGDGSSMDDRWPHEDDLASLVFETF